jgi:hypothetical protein
VKTTKQDEKRWVCEGHRTVGKLAHESCCARVQSLVPSRDDEQSGLASGHALVQVDSRV